jgi:hemerythrin HHE cation binding domain-containing protein
MFLEALMNDRIPASLKAEHDELHQELAAATKAAGSVGEAARAVAMVLHPHFVDEEAFALPPLGLLTKLVKGEQVEDPATVIAMTDRLKAELPRMLAEHRTITEALQKLEDAARGAGDAARAQLARKIIAHAQAEEEVMYPAAILVGEWLKEHR